MQPFDGAFFKKLEALSFVSRKPFLGLAKGERRGPRKGGGVEFQDFRPYVPGDDLRYLDWNVYSRLDRLILKLFVEEEDLCLHLLIDSSASMAFGSPPKFLHAVKTAAALGYIGLNTLERVAIGFFTEGVETVFGPRRGRRQIFPLLQLLSQVSPEGRTNLSAALTSYARKGAPGLAVVITDLLDPGYREGIGALLQKGFEVFLLHVLSEGELSPPLFGDIRLIDAEVGTAREVTVDAALLTRYRESQRAFFQEVETFCQKNQVGYIRASTAIPLDDLLLRSFKEGGLLR
ncbi:MAG: DUF58 domain-containing protein [candidate division NC10 bacterium]|nr:DUF58 domain-containing protein [candidate division NC10 bacterium]